MLDIACSMSFDAAVMPQKPLETFKTCMVTLLVSVKLAVGLIVFGREIMTCLITLKLAGHQMLITIDW